MDLVSFATNEFIGYILILFRVGSLMIAAPLLGSAVVPARVKIAASMVLALLLVPVVHPIIPQPLTLAYMVKVAASESVVGLLVGYSAGLIFVAVQLGGMQVGQQMGTAMASIFNPMLETQDSLESQFFFLLTAFIYLAIGGHHILLASIVGSFKTLPIGALVLSPRVLDMVIELFGYLFAIAFAISAPAVLALFLVTVAMGFVARTVPQMNILIVGFPVRILVGTIVLLFTLPAIGHFIARMIGTLLSGLPALVSGAV